MDEKVFSALEMIRNLNATPKWVTELVQDCLSTGNCESFVSIREHVPDESYIEFLDSQIRLNPRGDDWSNILLKRRAALRDSVGKNIMGIRFLLGSKRFLAEIRLDDMELIHSEEY